MNFTKTPPTTPGFYAWRAGKNGFAYNVKITDDLQVWYGAENQGLAHRVDGEWCRLVPAEEVEKAHLEGWINRDKYNYRDHDTVYKAHSRAKQIAEGKI